MVRIKTRCVRTIETTHCAHTHCNRGENTDFTVKIQPHTLNTDVQQTETSHRGKHGRTKRRLNKEMQLNQETGEPLQVGVS